MRRLPKFLDQSLITHLGVSTIQKQLNNQDLYHKTDIHFWDCFGKEKPYNSSITDYIFGVNLEGKQPSNNNKYDRTNGLGPFLNYKSH